LNDYEVILLLLASAVGLTALASRIRIPYPIVLTLGGAVMSAIKGLPAIGLDPQLVFTIFLPPLLFGGAYRTEWPSFRARFRAISTLAIGLVLATTAAVAALAHFYFGMSWATGFVLGAIVSPPDAVAAVAITQRLGVPKAIITILDGESLVNDASGLTAYRLAIAAVMTGVFSLKYAVFEFIYVVLTGILLGLAAGFIGVGLFRYLARMTRDDRTTLIAVTLLIPYAIYLPTERLHSSGVLATVTAGIFIGHHASSLFQKDQAEYGLAVWEAVEYFLNVLVFILIGLAIPRAVSGLSGYSPSTLALYAIALAATMIIVRMLWMYPGAYLPFLIPRIRRREYHPPLRGVTLIGWTGMRGVVSLAAALALPMTTSQGEHFPDRSLIIFLTATAIFSTLVVQGLTLPWVIRLLGVNKLNIPVDPRRPE
jgi:CPA1 family monovalent cation:H+ antiporter